MMQAIAKNTRALGLAVLLILGLYLYNTYFTSESVPDTQSAATIGADLIKISENISKATLSRELFSAAGYRLLSDFSTALVAQPTGRPNPFAPIGQD